MEIHPYPGMRSKDDLVTHQRQTNPVCCGRRKIPEVEEQCALRFKHDSPTLKEAVEGIAAKDPLGNLCVHEITTRGLIPDLHGKIVWGNNTFLRCVRGTTRSEDSNQFKPGICHHRQSRLCASTDCNGPGVDNVNEWDRIDISEFHMKRGSPRPVQDQATPSEVESITGWGARRSRQR